MMTPEPQGIATITLNPAIDETILIDGLRTGTVNRAISRYRQAGGKGVNISSMLAQFGISSDATGFLGETNPEIFENHFSDLGITDRFIRIAGETRCCLKLVDTATTTVTDINQPGLEPTRESLSQLGRILRDLAAPGRWFVFSGSLPPGIGTEDFILLLDIVRARGGLTAVDTSGPALQAAIHTGVDMIKPNRHELADACGVDDNDTQGLIQAAREFHTSGISHVILSLGTEGAFFATPGGNCVATAPPVAAKSTVGAGDSLLAGYLAGLQNGLHHRECAALATAFAWSAVENVRRHLPPPSEVDRRARMISVDLISKS